METRTARQLNNTKHARTHTCAHTKVQSKNKQTDMEKK